MDELPAKVQDLLTNKLDKTVYIRADARAKYQAVEDVVDNLRAAGVDQLGLITETPAGASGKPPPQLRFSRFRDGFKTGKENFLWQWQLAAAERVQANINVTPLIDVLLVLLIIFMVITPLTPHGLEAMAPQPPKKDQPTEAG